MAGLNLNGGAAGSTGGHGMKSAESRWGSGAPQGPRPMPILPRQATSTSRDFQSYSSSVKAYNPSPALGSAPGSALVQPPGQNHHHAPLTHTQSHPHPSSSKALPQPTQTPPTQPIPLTTTTLPLNVTGNSNGHNSSSKESLLAV